MPPDAQTGRPKLATAPTELNTAAIRNNCRRL
jgi:hypothetical protein